MKSLTSFLLTLLTCASALQAQVAGSLDPLNLSVTGNSVLATAVQPDGKTIIGGDFTQVLGVPRSNIARLNADGTLDTSFDPKASSVVYSVVVQTDGRVLIGGNFTTLQPNGAASATERKFVARLNSDGTLDAGFDPEANGLVNGLLVQPDGKVLLWGEFTSLQPNGAASPTTRRSIARVNADGTLDAAFDPNVNGPVLTLALHAGGMVVGGTFSSLQPNGALAATTRNNVAKLSADGSLDATFNPNANGSVNALYVQADEKVVLGGAFTTVSSTTRNRLARVTSAGVLEAFDPNAGGVVQSVVGQADGKLLVSGAFTTIGATTRNRVARLLADGSLDSTFNPNVTGGDVRGLAIQSGGQVFATGAFTSVGGTARSYLARLQNDTATQSLTVPTSARVQWLRGGASPEAGLVLFEVSTDAGVTYTLHGQGTRVTGGWEYVGALPVSGQLRARAFCAGGTSSASVGIVQTETVFSGFAVPDIAVEQPLGSNIDDGGSVVFGAVTPGSSVDREFTIRNTGTLDLTGLGITFDGVDTDRFSVVTPPSAPVAPNASTTFTVRFSPLNAGGHAATMRIASNDFDENPFDIQLTDSAALSANANLSNLTLNTGPISPSFSAATTSYTSSVLFATTSLTLTATKLQAGAVIRVNGNIVASGVASGSIPLNVGANVIDTVVTAADGATTKTYTVTVTRAGPAAGDLDLTFDPRMNSQTFSAVPQADGKILVTGYFGGFQPNGGAFTSRNYLARMNADGTSDAIFNTNLGFFNNIIYCVVPQSNGQILVGGEFTSVAGVTRNRIARFNANGTLDTTFNPNIDSSVYAILVQPDGKILVGGRFQNVQPNGSPVATSRRRIARFHADGTLDASFDPNANSDVYTFLLQPDGKIYVGGAFNTFQPNGAASTTNRNYLARLNADGTVDTAFNANSPHYILCMAQQTDGKIIVGGHFTSIGGQSRGRVARLDASGLADSFNPNANNAVYTLALQTDGKVLIGGDFTTLQPNGAATATTRNRMARVNADGTLEASFDPNFNDRVYGIALQADGQILVTGSYTAIGAVSRSYLVRLGNDAVSQSLTVPSASRIEWLRSGALPEAAAVTFEASIDGGITYTQLGAGTRISGGWEFLPALGTLPASGTIRALARSLGGYYNGSSGLTQATAAFSGFGVPDIVIEQPVGTNISDGGTYAFGAVAPGSTADRTFTVTNSGTVDLTGLGISFDGVDPERFSVITPPTAPVAPGTSTTFTVRFAPQNSGGHTATMRIASNDFDETPFDIALSDTPALSANPSLVSLIPSSGILVPTFSATTTSYTMSVPYATTGITFTPTRLQSAATIQVNGASVASGATSALIPLNVGANVINTVVTAADGTTTRTYAVTITRAGPVVGDVDLVFNPNVTSGSQMFCAAVQADGKILVGGNIFTFQPNGAVSGTSRSYFARLNADGTLDASVNLNVGGGGVFSIAIQRDGKVLIAGDFTQILGVTRNRVARLNADMTLDTSFNPNANSRVWTCYQQPDGKVIIGGSFTTLQPPGSPTVVTRNRIARLNADGSLDTSYDPSLNSDLYCMLPQASGKMLIGGAFSTLQPNGAASTTSRIGIARLNADGTLDTTFNANSNSQILCMAPLADGKVVVGGYFTFIGGQSRIRVARLDAAGLADSFNPNVNGDVFTLVSQADGKVVIGGNFTTLQPNGAATATTRNRIARVNADGSLDTVFDPNANAVVRGVTLQSDGQMLAYGDFTTMGAATRSRIARLGNDAATNELTVPNGSRVQWLIGGASSEAVSTYFEISTDAGVSYQPFGYGTRITGGWECLGSLPTAGQVRARATNSGGYYSSSAGITQAVTAFSGFLPADIAVELPDTTNIADGGSAVFGPVPQGSFSDLTFTLRNSGGVNLTGLDITFDGVDAPMFSVVSPPISPVVPGGSTTFTVRFAPTSGGGHVAAMHIASNDFDESPFDINLTDTGAASANADLSSLVLSSGTLSPSFSSAVTSYTASVLYGTTSLTLIPTRLQSSAIIQVNGSTVASGSSTAAIPLDIGANVITVIVTAADAVTTKTYTLTVNRAAAAAGDVDLTHDPRAWLGSNIYAYVPQPDGKILVGGYFFTLQPNGAVSPTTRNYFARINANGTLDTAFNPSVSSEVRAISLQSDGKIIITGYFTAVAGQTRNRIARLNADGTLDATFNPNANNLISSLVIQPDGKILIGGEFTTLQPNGAASATTRNRIARLNADGTLDSTFDPNANGSINSIAIQADGKILIGGSLNTLQPNGAVSATTRNRLARLNADGSIDTAFNPSLNGSPSCILVQTDGKIVIGGYFSNVNSTTRNRLARLNADGTLDSVFNPNVNNDVYSLALQADGKILLGGFFTTLQPNGAASATSRNRVARVNADGTLDTAFNPNANGTVRTVSLQADGQILVGGDFTSMGAATRFHLARLQNDTATQLLTVPSATRVEWLRGGSLPEASGVTFEVSINNGANYVFLGNGTRINGGWEYLPALGALPANGQLRANARSSGGFNSGSSFLTEAIALFPSAFPEIGVQHPVGTDLVTGTTEIGFGSLEMGGEGLTKTFTINNSGAGNLGISSVFVTGGDAGDFSVSTFGMLSVVPSTNGTTTFTVTARPSALLLRSTTLRIISNDTNESSFDIPLTATGIASTNANLTSLGLSSGTLSPVFASSTTSYTATVPNAVSSLTVTPVKSDANAVIRVNGSIVNSGSASGNIALSVGTNVITTVVTAQNSAVTKTYTVTVTRTIAPTITSPTIAAIAGSSVTLGGNVTSDGGAAITARGVVVSLTSVNSNPTLGGFGVSNFPVGGTTGVFTASVTGLSPGLSYSYRAYATNSDGTAQTSVGTFVTVTSNADLSSLALSSGALVPTFLSSVTSYNAAVPFGATSINVTPVKADSGASIQVRINNEAYIAANSGSSNGPFALNVVSNTLDILVTAQDGVTTKLYSIAIAFLPPPPTVTIVTPATGSTTGGTNVTIQGANFNGATSVTFGGIAATAVSVINPTTINATTPAGIAGTVSVVVSTPSGSNAANTLFTYMAPAPEIAVYNGATTAGPELTDGQVAPVVFSNTNIASTSTRTLTVANRGTAPLTLGAITIDGPDAAAYSVTTAPASPLTVPDGTTTFVVTFSPLTAGDKIAALHLVNNDSNENPFDINLTGSGLLSSPSLTLVTPASGPISGGTNVTITGINFTDATGVTFGGTAATNVTVVDDLTITATTPVGTVGTASVLVTTPSGTNAANTLFTYTNPVIEVRGNGVQIAAGDATPELADHTSFAVQEIGAGTQTRSFTIKNNGTAALNLSGLPLVSITGSNAADFSLTAAPAGSLSISAQTNFSIQFTPSAIGTASATLTIQSNDLLQPNFSFAISAVVIGNTEIGKTNNWLDVTNSLPTQGSIYRPIPGVINQLGYTSFKVMGTVGSGGITSGNDSLLVTDFPSGDLKVIGQEGMSLPGGGLLPGGFNNIILTAAGRSVVSERFNGATAATDYGYLISENGGTLQVLSREGDAATGGGVFITHSGRHASDDSERVYFPGLLSGVAATKNSGVWFDDAGDIVILAKEGDDAAALTGDLAWLGNFSAPLSAAGDGAAFVAALQNNPDNAAQKTSVALNVALLGGSPGSLELVARKGDLIPSVGKLGSFSAVSRGSNGDHAFISLLTLSTAAPVVTTANDQVIMAVIDGEKHLVARENQTGLVGGLKPVRFGNVYMASAGEVIYQAWLTGVGVTIANDSVLCRWTLADGNEVLAREGTAAPGTAFNYGVFQVFSVSAGGAVVLQSTLSTGIALMRAIPGAELELAVRTGTSLTFNGVSRNLLSLGIHQTGVGSGGGGGGFGAAINDDGAIFTVLSIGNGQYIARVYRP